MSFYPNETYKNTPNIPNQWPCNNYRQPCHCLKQENVDNYSCVCRPQKNKNLGSSCPCSCSKQNSDENYTSKPCACQVNEHQSTGSNQQYQQPAIQAANENQNNYENVEIQQQSHLEEMQLQCQCKACRKKVHAKFGLAWIVEGPGYENYEEPTGWQMEFIDTPSCVFQKCQEMIHWVNAPPVQASYPEHSHALCGGYNRSPYCICGGCHEQTSCYCEPKMLDVEERPVKDIKTESIVPNQTDKSNSMQTEVSPTTSKSVSLHNSKDNTPNTKKNISSENSVVSKTPTGSAELKAQELKVKNTDKPEENARRKISGRRRTGK